MRSTDKIALNELAGATQAETGGFHEAAPWPLDLSREELLKMHYRLVLARVFDERIWMLNRQGKTAFVISSAGQEGTQVGFAQALKPGHDFIFPYYRSLALVLALG